MYKILDISKSIKRTNKDWDIYVTSNRQKVGDFESSQTKMFGFLHKELESNPLEGWIPNPSHKSEIYNINALIPSGSGFIIENSILDQLRELQLPKCQIWKTSIELRKKYYNCYSLVYFYHDYFQEINFKDSVFELSIPKLVGPVRYTVESYTLEVEDDNFPISSLKEFQMWCFKNKYDTKIRPFEQPRLALKKIKLKDEIYRLDIIPTMKYTRKILVSENVKKILLENKVKNVEFIEFSYPIMYSQF